MNYSDRLLLQTQIENDILRLDPEFDDAAALICAIHVSLKRRYPAEQMWDANHFFETLDEALERAPMLAPPEVDECALGKEEKE